MMSGRTLSGIVLAVCLCPLLVPKLRLGNERVKEGKGGPQASGYPLIPLSGADGEFETTERDGTTVYRGKRGAKGDYAAYLYFRVPPGVPRAKKAVYVEVTYLDEGTGPLTVQYNASGPSNNYKPAEIGYGKFLTNRGTMRTGVFRLADPDFRQGQNLGADLRLCSPGGKVPLQVTKAILFVQPPPLFLAQDARPWLEPYRGPSRSDVSAKTLHKKVLCGYQGWFRCPGDAAEKGWVHWSRDAIRIAPETLAFEMWPDLSEFSSEEKYPAPGFTHRDGKPAFLFSSANPQSVERHFDWMRKYGIDGALVQRFVAGVEEPESSRVLGYARAAANRTGRVFAVEYDMTGTPPEKLFDLITRDWKWLVDEMKITADPRYLHHDGRPVLAVWGFFSDRFDASLAHRIIDFFKKDNRYRVTLVGGCQWPWREERSAAWAKVFRRFDIISPWNVGNCVPSGNTLRAKTEQWPGDMVEARRAGMLFMPVVFPGFSWDNRQGKKPGSTNIPRRRGELYWEQFSTVARLGIDVVKVAMFDEVDEGTAIFKVSNTPPRQGHFVTYDGMPSDWYLRLTGEGAKLIRGERRNTGKIPIKP